MLIMFNSPNIYVPKHSGALSLKCVQKGNEIYETEKDRFEVDRDHFLILNHGQDYFSYITPPETTESFCLFFGKSFSEDVFRTLTSGIGKLLDEPSGNNPRPFTFRELLYPRDKILNLYIEELRLMMNNQNGLNTLRFEEIFYDLLKNLFLIQKNLHDEIDETDAQKLSIKLEVLKRLNLAKDFINSSFCRDISLSEVAALANLSPYYFLRLFKKTFGETPRQYIIGLRLQKAESLLRKTDMTITDITFSTGLESPSYFSRLFQNHFGISPKKFRKSK